MYISDCRQILNKREPVYQALWAGPCDFDEVLISPVMIQDHMPDNMLRALNKVSPSDTLVRQVRKSQIPLSRTPSVKPGHYEPLEETIDGPDVLNEEAVHHDVAMKISDAVNGRNCSCTHVHYDRTDCTGINNTSVIVNVEVHERKGNQLESC